MDVLLVSMATPAPQVIEPLLMGANQREGGALTRVCSAELCLEGRQRGAEVKGGEVCEVSHVVHTWMLQGPARPSHVSVAQEIKEVELAAGSC